jgi:integrase
VRQELQDFVRYFTRKIIPNTAKLMAALLYGSGLRVMECVRLRVKEIDFAYAQISVRDAKGGRDRVAMLPVNLVEPLQRHLLKVSKNSLKLSMLRLRKFRHCELCKPGLPLLSK